MLLQQSITLGIHSSNTSSSSSSSSSTPAAAAEAAYLDMGKELSETPEAVCLNLQQNLFVYLQQQQLRSIPIAAAAAAAATAPAAAATSAAAVLDCCRSSPHQWEAPQGLSLQRTNTSKP